MTLASNYDDKIIRNVDYSELLEIAQITLNKRYVEILEINGGEYYVLSVSKHSDKTWNISTSSMPKRMGRPVWYRFETLLECKEALSRFMVEFAI